MKFIRHILSHSVLIGFIALLVVGFYYRGVLFPDAWNKQIAQAVERVSGSYAGKILAFAASQPTRAINTESLAAAPSVGDNTERKSAEDQRFVVPVVPPQVTVTVAEQDTSAAAAEESAAPEAVAEAAEEAPAEPEATAKVAEQPTAPEAVAEAAKQAPAEPEATAEVAEQPAAPEAVAEAAKGAPAEPEATAEVAEQPTAPEAVAEAAKQAPAEPEATAEVVEQPTAPEAVAEAAEQAPAEPEATAEVVEQPTAPEAVAEAAKQAPAEPEATAEVAEQPAAPEVVAGAGSKPAVPATMTQAQDGDESIAEDISDQDFIGVDELWLKARKAYGRGDMEAAVQHYLALTKQESDNPDAFGELGNVYFATGRFQEAGQAYYEAAIRLNELGRVQQAQHLARIIEGLDPESAAKLKQHLMR